MQRRDPILTSVHFMPSPRISLAWGGKIRGLKNGPSLSDRVVNAEHNEKKRADPNSFFRMLYDPFLEVKSIAIAMQFVV
jgi:hypothetical protein